VPGNGTDEEARVASVLELDGVHPQLGMLPPETIITLKGYAAIFDKTPRTVERWCEKGQLPQPVPQGEDMVWINEVIVNHLRKRLEKAQGDWEREHERPARYGA